MGVKHEALIHRCLELADNGRGSVGINPLVGAVLVREGKVIGEGWHASIGEDHAERDLIKKIDQAPAPEDALYVNLEPCNHHGKTPPCTDLIIQSGIKHVVYGMLDPNPKVAGQGIAALRAAGIDVTGPILPEPCRRHNRGFVSLQERGKPYITLKKAQTREGAIANDDGSPLKITSKEQDEWSHQNLRAKHDAILVGSRTIERDNPQLTVRLSNNKVDQTFPQPLRLILNSDLSISPEANVVKEGTILIADKEAKSENEAEFLERGVRILRIPLDGDHFDWKILWSMLTSPDDDFVGITSILVEGGPKTWSLFKEAGQYDEEVVLVGFS